MVRTLACAIFTASLALPANATPRSAGGEKERSPGASVAFAEAKKAFTALKKDPKRRKFRDAWLSVAQRFTVVAEKYPTSPLAPGALYDAGELYAELSRVSLAKRDLNEAIETYTRLCARYPGSNLADDAHFALARIYRDRTGDTVKAESELRATVACKGDMQGKAKAALAELDSAPKAKSARPGPKERPEPARREAAKAHEDLPAQRNDGEPSKVNLATHDEEDDEDEADAVGIPVSASSVDPARVKALKEAARSEVPLSVQVGLKIKRIILDAGHGGHDTGAIGPRGVYEKDVALAIARKLKTRLEAKGYEALLTRDADRFVALEDRARFANKHKGDLFVSIHCNAHKSAALRGVETYTLNVTSDQYATRLAARENASSERSLSDLQLVLADLATKVNTADSVKLARAVQSELVEAESEGKSRAKDLGVKQALFYVLLGARMPSVLVETAFLSNPADERWLSNPVRQKTVAEAIALGIERFVSERNAMASALTE